mmetsp:Transcript_32214/g.102682  ORF Transcript_32214/g.102682 Transcript_32214/m.102682 type:complete len:202 (+) Transcript_32214:3209-3814(+)
MRFLLVVASVEAVLLVPRRGVLLSSPGVLLSSARPLSAAVPPRQEDLTALGLETPALKESDAPFAELATGVKVKTLRPGAGDAVTPTSTVSLECTGRFLNLNGVKFYSTLDNPDATALGGPEPLKVQLGAGQLIPGLEDGILGARKNEIRRIIVPASRGYDLASNLEPRPTGLGLNALNSVLKNPRRDGTMLFDVKVVRVK